MFNCPHDQEIVHLCNEYPSKQCENSFPLDWVFHSGLCLAAFLISKQPSRSYSYTPGGLGLVGLCPWLFSDSFEPLHPQTVLSWASLLGNEKVTLENILVYYYTQRSKINHARCMWNHQQEEVTSLLILSTFLFISIMYHFGKPLNHLVKGSLCS